MNALVKFIGNDVFTDSMVIAEGTGNQHESVVSLIKTHRKSLGRFGNLEFTDFKSGKRGRPTRIFQLNEPQATLLVTFLDNNDIVVEFKVELVRQFYEMRRLLMERQSPHWQATRLESKKNRRMETDEIKMLVEYAKAQGSKNADKYYISFSKLANKAVGIQADSRDALTTSQLNNLILIEHIIGEVIKESIRQEMYYKDIYKACKLQIQHFQKIAYLAA
ncbi:MAG: Rha family transcriptional regulator [Enterocloster clostridioformis]|jgi:phage regulator Rha-like protein|uniref:Rha family transcriptional regulator n=2 Tax=Enterocloster TaxID=2719313 RepID=UPI00242E4335|nr:Rha family transcriptional regulator [Enterocloster clostridioformis]MCI6128029.1 Rha family transcriptional regulator [Enterocloster clostridioformis]MDY4763522.1 Rha family transcriptional regulator [Enterocloster clostridioformis]